MNFVSTFCWSFRFWQFFSLTPLSLTVQTSRPYKNPKLRTFAIFSLKFFIVLTICGITFIIGYTDWEKSSKIIAYNTAITMLLLQFTSCVILAESILNINRQINFLERMNRIDYALTHKLQLKIDYQKYQFRNNALIVIWIFLHLIYRTVVTGTLLDDQNYLMFVLLHTIPFALYTLHYLHMIVYVYQIRHRYALLNQFILETFPLEDIMIEIQKVNIDFEKNNHLKAQLLELRDIYQELHDASHTINNIFRWSIPLCIGFDEGKIARQI